MDLKEQINAALNAHGSWKVRLRTAIESGKSEVAVADVRSDRNCAFGKWLYGLDPKSASSPNSKACKELHAKFHVAASEVLRLALSGKKQEALRALDAGSEFAALSGKLTLALVQWANAA